MAKLAAFKREAGQAGKLGQTEADRFGEALQPAARSYNGSDAVQGFECRRRIGRLRVFQCVKGIGRIIGEGGENGEVQGEADSQAAGGGKGLFGAADADQRRRIAGEEGTAFKRQSEGVRRCAIGFAEPAQHLGAFAGLRGNEDRLAFDDKRLAELFRERQGNGVDAMGAVERLDGATDGMRAAHAEQQQLAGRLQ
ncbi:hypothetical protein D9M72_481250 [compost metagenome]